MAYGLRPVCVKCRKFLRNVKSGVPWEEGMPITPSEPMVEINELVQIEDDAQVWAPYRLWIGDLLRCPECGIELILGHGSAPLAEHYQPDYAAVREKFSPRVRVNDC